MNNEYIEKLLKNLKHKYYAHTKDNGECELLISHLDLTYKYYKKMEKRQKLRCIGKKYYKRYI